VDGDGKNPLERQKSEENQIAQEISQGSKAAFDKVLGRLIRGKSRSKGALKLGRCSLIARC